VQRGLQVICSDLQKCIESATRICLDSMLVISTRIKIGLPNLRVLKLEETATAPHKHCIWRYPAASSSIARHAS